MIIGYNFFSKDFHGNVWDTAIPTSHIDEVIMGEGIYDDLFITVDTAHEKNTPIPDRWKLKTIMHSKFKGDLEGGSIGGGNHRVRNIQIYRRKHQTNEPWLLISQFPYDSNYNMYSFVDRFTENGAKYEYAIVPLSKDVMGEVTVSEPVQVDYEGVFITDLYNNYQLEVDFNLGQVTYNNNMSTSSPLNGRFPIVTYGNQDYRTGTVDFLPLSDEQKQSKGTKIDGKLERQYKENVLEFLKSPQAKVIRNDNGDMIVVATHGITTQSKNGNLIDLNAVSFSFTEVGKLDYNTMTKGGLIGEAGKSRYTFDERGNIVWAIDYIQDTENAVRTHRNSFPKKLGEESDKK